MGSTRHPAASCPSGPSGAPRRRPPRMVGRVLTRVLTRVLGVALPLALAVPALSLVPSAVAPGPRPKPVPPSVTHLPLAGVDPGELRRLVAAQGPLVAADGLRGDTAAAVPGSAVRPRVLTGRITARRAFQTLGVTWNGGPLPDGVTIYVRTHPEGRPAGSGWTGWEALEEQPGETAPAPGQRSGTEPVWAGPSDGVQVRVDGPTVPAGLRVDLVDAGTSPYDAVAGRGVPGSAVAAAGRPTILSRAQWGADESRVRAPATVMSTIKAGMVHHTADANGYTAAQVPAIIRGDYAYHLSRGWNDIGYNFLVDRFGRIWEGRAGGVEKAVMGAHSGGFNTDTFGVAILGNYQSVRPSSASIRAVERVFAWKLDLYHRDPLGSTLLTSAGGGTSRYPAGTTVRKPVMMGHRDVGQTDCPGRYVYALLPSMRRAVSTLMGAALLEPRPPAAAVAYGAGAKVSAVANLRQGWRLDVTRLCPVQRVARVTGTAAARTRFTAAWNGRAGSAPARPGGYLLALSSSATGTTARGWSARTTVLPPAPPPPPAAVPATGAGGFVPVPPARLLDTRSGAVLPAGPDGRVDLQVTGRAGIPANGVTSVVLHVTGTCGTTDTPLSVWPAGAARPGTSVLVAPAATTVSGLTTVAVGAGGKVSLGTLYGVTDLVVDVVGYHASGTGADLLPVTATRVFDTATDPGGELVPGSDRQVTLPTLAGVAPGQVTAVVANLVVTAPTGSGTLVGWAQGAAAPDTSSLVVRAGRDAVGRAVIGVSGGKLMLRARNSSYRVAVDVVGVYTGAVAGDRFTAVTGTRLLDTRDGGTRISSGSTRTLTVAGGSTPVPANASAVLLTVVAVSPGAATTLRVGPSGGTLPTRPDVRAAAGEVAANAVLVAPGAGGAVELANNGSVTHVVVDLIGYYS